MQTAETYTDGTYLAKTGGSWHVEDSGFKAQQVRRMLARHPHLPIEAVCDIGCGAGGVLHALEPHFPMDTRFVGYEISPQAHSLSHGFSTGSCKFVLDDPFRDRQRFDLALILDVVEHVDDCFGFMRECGAKATWKMYHIPLDTSASMALRAANCWDTVGHVHLFTAETALKSVEHAGQSVADWFLTPVALQRPHRFATRWTNLARRVVPERLGARLLGGYSIMILAQ